MAVGIGRVCARSARSTGACDDADGIELRLGEAHPVAFFQRFDAMFGKSGEAEFGAAGLQDARNIGIALEQCIHEIVLPDRGSGFAGFAEDRLLVRRVGIGIQHVHRQRAVCQQRLTQRFGVSRLGAHGEREPGHAYLAFDFSASLCSR